MKTPDEKLTLKLKRSSIARAKEAAKQRGTSVSRMVEDYFEHLSLPAPMAGDGGISENLRSLMGVIKLPKGFDHKKEYRKHLFEKYGR